MSNLNITMPRRIGVNCIQCREPKEPVKSIMKDDGYTPDTYVCSKCRAANGRRYQQEMVRQIKADKRKHA